MLHSPLLKVEKSWLNFKKAKWRETGCSRDLVTSQPHGIMGVRTNNSVIK